MKYDPNHINFLTKFADYRKSALNTNTGLKITVLNTEKVMA